MPDSPIMVLNSKNNLFFLGIIIALEMRSNQGIHGFSTYLHLFKT
jgi:hypothetical protein